MTDLSQYQFELKKALLEESLLLKDAQVPIITVSASFRKELLKKYHSFARGHSEVIYSRAHYSMAEAIRQQAIAEHKTTHLMDPTNFVSSDDWKKVDFTEEVGHLMARHKPLKWLKDQIDTVARSKLPITDAITPPLIYLTDEVTQPIISLHYEAGNIVAQTGKTIIQMLTDPHVRPQYLDPLPDKDSITQTSNLYFGVFDKGTKKELIHVAKDLGKVLDPKTITVTGPPVDPRISASHKITRSIKPNQPLKLVIATGGLGTNLDEIKQVLTQLAPLLQPPEKLQLFLYAGNHRDFRNLYENFATKHNLRVGNLDDDLARIRILYEDSIIDANENLINYAFPWTHGFVTKPSGDMAYEAAASGCFLLFLEPWGEWEQNIQSIFTKNKVGHDLNVDKALPHLQYLLSHKSLHQSLQAARRLPSLFRQGPTNLLKLHSKISSKNAI